MTQMAKGMKKARVGSHTVVMLEVQEPCTSKRRLVSMDIDDVEDWGDIKMTKNGDGEVSGEVVTYGDDAWEILNAYRVVPLGDGKHNGKFPMAEAIELEELYGMLLERFEEFQG